MAQIQETKEKSMVNFWTAENIIVLILKFCKFYCGAGCPECYDSIAIGMNLTLMWVYTACPYQSVSKIRKIVVNCEKYMAGLPLKLEEILRHVLKSVDTKPMNAPVIIKCNPTPYLPIRVWL